MFLLIFIITVKNIHYSQKCIVFKIMIVGNELQIHTDAWFYCHGSSDLMRALLPCNSNPAYHIKCCKIKCNVSERLNWPFQKLSPQTSIYQGSSWKSWMNPKSGAYDQHFSKIGEQLHNSAYCISYLECWKAIATANLPWHIKYSSDSQSVGCSRALEVLQMACQI